MFKIRFVKAVMIGMCLSVLSVGVVCAQELSATTMEIDQTKVDQKVLDKQTEVDKYLFEDHKKDIEEKGFKITHTAPMETVVEVGITPYNKENADYLYEVLGEDMVTVVEGTSMEAWSGVSEPNIEPVAKPLTSATDNKTENNKLQIIGIVLGAMALGGISIVALKKKKQAS